jgi:FKBP-type peptidyl-prolyl cis-trans isomerase
MALKVRLTCTALLVVGLLAARVSAQETPILMARQDKMSYAVGVDLSRNFTRQGIEVDADLVAKGLRDVFSGGKLLIPEEDLRSAMTAFQVELGQTEALARKVSVSVGYGSGVAAARNLKLQQIKVNVDLMTQGLKDAFSGGKLLMTEEGFREAMAVFQIKLKHSWGKSMRLAKEYNKKEDTFLAENKTKEGVVALPSGLQYKVLKAGDGQKPTDADTVQVHHQGFFTDGTEFESSYNGGQPVTLKVTGAIPGWREALKLMPVGSKWQLFVSPHLVSGAREGGLASWPIPTLVFDLELLAIN